MEEKYEFVEKVIDMLNMRDFANAVVGTPGEGLNVEQRKLLTIGVELAARPKLLLFLDEPTSGLDSQSSWAICAFLRKLADAGQAVLCTVHQPTHLTYTDSRVAAESYSYSDVWVVAVCAVLSKSFFGLETELPQVLTRKR